MTMLFEGPRIPRSCDPDWGMRDSSGHIKPECAGLTRLSIPIVNLILRKQNNEQEKGRKENT